MEKDDFQELIDSGVLQKNPDIQIVKKELEALAEKGFIKGMSGQYFEFDNNLTWEVVYETLLFGERRRIHALVASHIKKYNENNLESVADVLSHHYKKAEDIENYIWFTALSGERAAGMHANDDALNRFGRATDAILEVDENNVGDVSLIKEKIGDIYDSSGRHSEAIESYIQALTLWSNGSHFKRKLKFLLWKLKPALREAHICQKIAAAYEHKSMYDSSIDWLDKAVNSLPKRPGHVIAQICASRCAVLYRKGEYKTAIISGEQAVVYAKKSKDLNSTAYAYSSLANNYQYCGKVEKAIGYNKKSLEIYERIKDFVGIASVSNNLANCFTVQAKVKSAIKHYAIVLETYKKIQNEFGVAMGSLNLSTAYLFMGKLSEAESYVQKVFESFEAGNCPPDMAGAAWTMKGVCKIESADFHQANECVDKAIELIGETGQVGILSDAILAKAEIMIEVGSLQEGILEIENVQKKIAGQGAVHIDAAANRVLGLAKARMGLVDEAVANFENSISSYNENGARLMEAITIIYQLRELSEAGYECSDSASRLNRAAGIFKSAGNELYLERARALQSRLH